MTVPPLPPSNTAEPLDPAEPDHSKRLSRRSAISVAGAVLVALALYALVVITYAQSSRTPERPELPETTGVSVYVEPTAVRPADRELRALINVVPPSSLVTENGSLGEELSITFFNDSGAIVMNFEAGEPAISLARIESIPFTEGAYDAYPLDRYSSTFAVVASTSGSASGSAPSPADEPTQQAEQTRWYPTQVAVWGDVEGWRIPPATYEMPFSSVPVDATEPAADTVNYANVSANRAGSTVTIVALLLLAMVAAAVLAVAVATAVWRRKRRPEPNLAGWGAALLFAMVPLRINMPGAPPIGAWLDFLIFLWVLLVLLIALTAIVSAWLAYSDPPGPRPAPRG